MLFPNHSLTALVVALRLAVLEEDPVRLGPVQRLGEDGRGLLHGGAAGVVVVAVVVVRPIVHVVDVRAHSGLASEIVD